MKSRIPKSNPSIISGSGKEFSDVSREISGYLDDWIQASGLHKAELRQHLSCGSYRIEERSSDLDDRLVVAIRCIGSAAEQVIGEPFVWDPSVMSREEFRMTVALILISMSQRYGGEKFRASVKLFAKNV